MNKITIACCCTLAVVPSALAVSHPWHYQKDLIDKGSAYVLTQWKLDDKGWRPRVRPGGHWAGDFYPFNEHFDKWVIVSTNAAVRPMSVPAHSIYRDNLTNLTAQVGTLAATNAVLAPAAQKAWKVEHAREKAAKKDKQNLDKLIKSAEKSREKSSEAMRDVYDSVLELLTNRVNAVTANADNVEVR